MFRLFKKKYVYPELKWPSYAREMTEYEKRFVVNGGKTIGNSIAEQAEAEEGDILIDDAGNEHVLGKGDIKWAKDKMAERNGTTATTPPSTGGSGSSGSGSGSGTGGSGGNSGTSGNTPSSPSSSTKTNDATSNTVKGPNHRSAYDQKYINEMMEKDRKNALGGNGIQGNAVAGKKVEGEVVEPNIQSITNIEPQYNNSTFREKVAGYTAKAVRDDTGRRTRGYSITTENYPKACKNGPSQLGEQDPLPLVRANGFDVLTAEYTRSANKMEVTYYNIRNGSGVVGIHSFSFEMTNKVRNELNGLRQDPDIKTIPAQGEPNWYYPREFPNGDWNILKSIPKNGSKDFGTVFIPTNAYQTVPVYGSNSEHPKCENGILPPVTGTQVDTGYGFHYSDYQTTWGCGRGSTQTDITKFAKWSDQALSTFYGGSYVNVHD